MLFLYFQGRSIQFDQWRIAHLAEFGICNFSAPSAARPPPAATPAAAKTPKAKRKAQEASEPRPKARRDSEPTPEPMPSSTPPPPSSPGDTTPPSPENNKENKEPEAPKKKEDTFASKIFQEKGGCKTEAAEAASKEATEAGGGEQTTHTQDPFPKLYNMAQQTFTKDGKVATETVKKTEETPPKQSQKPPTSSAELRPFRCDKCGTGFRIVLDYMLHQHSCRADEEKADKAGPKENGGTGSRPGSKPAATSSAGAKQPSQTNSQAAGGAKQSDPDSVRNEKKTPTTRNCSGPERPADRNSESKPAHHSTTKENGCANSGGGGEDGHDPSPPTRVTFKNGQAGGMSNGLSTPATGGTSNGLKTGDMSNGSSNGVSKVAAQTEAGSPGAEATAKRVEDSCLEDEDVDMPEDTARGHQEVNRNKIQMESLRESLPSAHSSSGSSLCCTNHHIPLMLVAMLVTTALALRVTLEFLSPY